VKGFSRWDVRLRCLPASGPISSWKTSARRPRLRLRRRQLACWGDHFEVDKALSDDTYCARKRELLEKYDLQVFAISNHLVGQAVLDNIDARHKSILPPTSGRRQARRGQSARAIEEMKNTARAARKLGVGVVNGFTGSSIWHLIYDFPRRQKSMIDDGFKLLADRWNPILDVFRNAA